MHNEMTIKAAPTPVSQFTTTTREPLLYPEGGPYYPTAFAAANGISGDLNLFYRAIPLGPRVVDLTTSAWRAVVGAEGIAAGWTYGAALTYSRNQQTERLHQRLGFRRSGSSMRFATGLINPFGPSGPEGDALLAATQLSGEAHTATGTTVQLDAQGIEGSLEPPRRPSGDCARRRGTARAARQPVCIIHHLRRAGRTRQPTRRARPATCRSLFVEGIVPDPQDPRGAARRALRPLQRFRRHDQSQGRAALAAAADAAAAKLLGHRLSRADALRRLHAAASEHVDSPLSRTIRCAARSPARLRIATCSSPPRAAAIPTSSPKRRNSSTPASSGNRSNGLSLTVDYWKINKNNYIGTAQRGRDLRQLRVLRADQYRPRTRRSRLSRPTRPDPGRPAVEPEPRPRAHVGVRRRRELARTGYLFRPLELRPQRDVHQRLEDPAGWIDVRVRRRRPANGCRTHPALAALRVAELGLRSLGGDARADVSIRL